MILKTELTELINFCTVRGLYKLFIKLSFPLYILNTAYWWTQKMCMGWNPEVNRSRQSIQFTSSFEKILPTHTAAIVFAEVTKLFKHQVVQTTCPHFMFVSCSVNVWRSRFVCWTILWTCYVHVSYIEMPVSSCNMCSSLPCICVTLQDVELMTVS